VSASPSPTYRAPALPIAVACGRPSQGAGGQERGHHSPCARAKSISRTTIGGKPGRESALNQSPDEEDRGERCVLVPQRAGRGLTWTAIAGAPIPCQNPSGFSRALLRDGEGGLAPLAILPHAPKRRFFRLARRDLA
jgi:hypothetical protein